MENGGLWSAMKGFWCFRKKL